MRANEEIVARALNAQEWSRSLTAEASRVSSLARLLREVRAGSTMLLRCAWCGRLEVAGEWLELDAIGSGQTRIAQEIVRRSTHGICPECFAHVSRDADAQRSG